jgi:hypothetical protein
MVRKTGVANSTKVLKWESSHWNCCTRVVTHVPLRECDALCSLTCPQLLRFLPDSSRPALRARSRLASMCCDDAPAESDMLSSIGCPYPVSFSARGWRRCASVADELFRPAQNDRASLFAQGIACFGPKYLMASSGLVLQCSTSSTVRSLGPL